LTLWHRQLANFWQPTWLFWPDAGLSETEQRNLFYETPVGKRWQQERPSENPDLWMVRYHLALHRLDARRQTRGFDAWRGVAGLDKDSLSGREEAVADAEWLKTIPRGQQGKKNDLNHHLRKNDPLGAPNLVKRVWHKAYLEAATSDGGMGLDNKTLGGSTARGSYFDMPSVPGVAVFPWACEIWRRRKGGAIQRFWSVVEKLDAYLDLQLPQQMNWAGESAKAWLARVDWDVFREDFWQEQLRSAKAASEPEWEALANEGAAAVRQFIAEEQIKSPSSYYAVLAGDGDNMGRWLSGEQPDRTLFNLRQDFHERLSEAIARFSTENAKLSEVIEDVAKDGPAQDYPFQGKIIYAGGEDVLALLPADQAIDCAVKLRMLYQDAMPHPSAQARFTYSVGLAIGHVKEPLQDMVEAARRAEKRAKDLPGKDALAVTLFKRSGETIEWSCPFGANATDPSATLKLLQYFQGNDAHGHPRFRAKFGDPAYDLPISGKFPHRLAELLARYQTYQTRGGLPDHTKPEPITAGLRQIAEREVAWAISRQCKNMAPAEQQTFLSLCASCLAELEARGAPLREFYHLFAIEAFLARQGE
jgi:CRISPR-associated protein Cas10/Cmr2 subtype III-B